MYSHRPEYSSVRDFEGEWRASRLFESQHPVPPPGLPLFRNRSEPFMQVTQPNNFHPATGLVVHPYSSVLPQSKQFSNFSSSPVSYEQEKSPIYNEAGSSWPPAVSSGPDIVPPRHPLSYSGAGRFWKPPDTRSRRNRLREWIKWPKFGKKASQSLAPSVPHSVGEARYMDQEGSFIRPVESGGLGAQDHYSQHPHSAAYLQDKIDCVVQKNPDQRRTQEKWVQSDGEERLTRVQTIIGEPAISGPSFPFGSRRERSSQVPRDWQAHPQEDAHFGFEKQVQDANLSVSSNRWNDRWEPKDLCFTKHDRSMLSLEEQSPSRQSVGKVAPSRAFSDPIIPRRNSITGAARGPSNKNFRSFSDAGGRLSQSWYDHEVEQGGRSERSGDSSAFAMKDNLVEDHRSQSGSYPLWQQRQVSISHLYMSTSEEGDFLDEPSSPDFLQLNSPTISQRNERYEDELINPMFGVHDPSYVREFYIPDELDEEDGYWRDAAGHELELTSGLQA